MPAGTLELVINLAEDEFRLYDRDDPLRCTRFAGALVSGAYSRYFVIDTREHASIIGAHFKLGGAVPFFGMPLGPLADRHVEVSQLWGPLAREMRNQLCEASSLQQRFKLLERALLKRLSNALELRPATRAGLEWLRHGRRVGGVAKELALSRRRFITVFNEDVGLTPKLFARVHRFQRTVAETKTLAQELLHTAQAFLDQQLMAADTTAGDARETAAVTLGPSGSEISGPIYTLLGLSHREGSITKLTGLVLLARPAWLNRGRMALMVSEISRHRAERGWQANP